MNGYLQSEKMPDLHGNTESGAWEESEPVLVLLSGGKTTIGRGEVWDEEEQISEWYLCNSDHMKLSNDDVLLWAPLPEWRKIENGDTQA